MLVGTAVIFFDLYFACCVIITDGVKVMSPGMCMNEVKMGSFQFNIFRVRIPRQRAHGNACCTRLFAVQLLKGRWFMLEGADHMRSNIEVHAKGMSIRRYIL